MVSTFVLVAAVLAGIRTTSARQALSVSLSGAGHFAGVTKAVVTATVTNTGDEALRVLNAPNSVLSKVSTDVFAISSSEGKAPRFQGLFAKYTPHAGKAFTALAPGESVTVEHSLAEAYDFSQSGAGTYRVDVAADFYVVDNGSVKTLTASVAPHTARLTGDLVKHTSPAPRSSAVFIDCTTAHVTALKAAAISADALTQDAAAYIAAHSFSTATDRYKTWFGPAPTVAQYGHVSNIFGILNATSFTTYTYECLAPAGCAGVSDSEAFTRTDTPGHFFVCQPFYTAPTSGTESQPGILVHLGTHWNTVGHTGHWGEGVGDAKALAVSQPELAIDNADSYEFLPKPERIKPPPNFVISGKPWPDRERDGRAT